jgi:hypothetical protein
VLTDPTQPEAFRRSGHWASPLLDFRLRVPQQRGALALGSAGEPAYRSNSLSGHERNRLFLQGGEGFIDLSLVSGTDSPLDARSFALLDYDRDGWLDIALMSVGAPRFQLFRNRIAELSPDDAGRVVTLRLVGANRSPGPVPGASNRDGVGALVVVETSLGPRAFRRSAGEGLAAVNAAALRFALREGEELRSVEVRWPSGDVTRLTNLPTADEVVLREGEAGGATR